MVKHLQLPPVENPVNAFSAPDAVPEALRIAVIDLPVAKEPRLAHWNGDSPVYPASVPKFVYLMAAYAWRDAGQLEIDPAFDRQLQAMIYASSNRATQRVVRRLTDTEAGPRLAPEDYAEFSRRRHAVKRWLEQLGCHVPYLPCRLAPRFFPLAAAQAVQGSRLRIAPGKAADQVQRRHRYV